VFLQDRSISSNKIAGNLYFQCFALLLFACRIAGAQQNVEGEKAKESKDTTRVTLASTNGSPGESVTLPIYLTPAKGLKIGGLKLEVNFVSANLKFDKIDRGMAAEMGDVELNSELKLGKNEKGVETSSVTVRASAPKESKEGIPSGLLAYLILKINETGRPASIALHVTAEGTEAGSANALTNLQSPDTQVDVVAPGSQPAISCFFFSH